MDTDSDISKAMTRLLDLKLHIDEVRDSTVYEIEKIHKELLKLRATTSKPQLDQIYAPIQSPSPPSVAGSIRTVQSVSPDTPIPSIEDLSLKSKNWRPLAIRHYPDISEEARLRISAKDETEAFSWAFLHDLFGGTEWSPGVYYTPKAYGPCILPRRTYYVLESENDPYIPRVPGDHGAKLVPFFNPSLDPDGADSECFPVFVNLNDSKADKYYYFGMYSQLRWSDKLDYDRMLEQVPQYVKMHWAEKLADPGRPQWMTDLLKQAFWPKPEFTGDLTEKVDGDTGVNDDEVAVRQYVDELREWNEEANSNVKELSKEFLLESFERVSLPLYLCIVPKHAYQKFPIENY